LLEAIHKRRLQSGRFIHCVDFPDKGEGGCADCGRPNFLLQNSAIFRKLWCVRQRGKGLRQCGQGGVVQSFCDFVQTSVMWTAPYERITHLKTI